ncbi:MAG: hypothetical protein AAF986_04890, partial [Pseudomonadota bacterium]
AAYARLAEAYPSLKTQKGKLAFIEKDDAAVLVTRTPFFFKLMKLDKAEFFTQGHQIAFRFTPFAEEWNEDLGRWDKSRLVSREPSLGVLQVTPVNDTGRATAILLFPVSADGQVIHGQTKYYMRCGDMFDITR